MIADMRRTAAELYYEYARMFYEHELKHTVDLRTVAAIHVSSTSVLVGGLAVMANSMVHGLDPFHLLFYIAAAIGLGITIWKSVLYLRFFTGMKRGFPPHPPEVRKYLDDLTAYYENDSAAREPDGDGLPVHVEVIEAIGKSLGTVAKTNWDQNQERQGIVTRMCQLFFALFLATLLAFVFFQASKIEQKVNQHSLEGVKQIMVSDKEDPGQPDRHGADSETPKPAPKKPLTKPQFPHGRLVTGAADEPKSTKTDTGNTKGTGNARDTSNTKGTGNARDTSNTKGTGNARDTSNTKGTGNAKDTSNTKDGGKSTDE